MEDKIKELALLRKDIDYARRVLGETELRLWGTEIGNQVFAMRTVVKNLVDEADAVRDQLNSEALRAYANDSNKHPHPAVTVKENKKLSYKPDEAIAWALGLEQMDMVSLNKTAFEKAAKVLDLDFVKKYTEPSVTVSTDLSSYIETPDVE